MIIPDGKKLSTILMGRMGKPGDVPVAPEAEVDSADEGLKTAAEDVMHALENKSAHDLMTALKAFFDLCDNKPEEGPEEE